MLVRYMLLYHSSSNGNTSALLASNNAAGSARSCGANYLLLPRLIADSHSRSFISLNRRSTFGGVRQVIVAADVWIWLFAISKSSLNHDDDPGGLLTDLAFLKTFYVDNVSPGSVWKTVMGNTSIFDGVSK